MILGRTRITRFFSAALCIVALSSAVAQCVTAEVSAYPPANACCEGSIGGAFYIAAGPAPVYARFTNVETEQILFSNLYGNGGGVEFGQSMPPGDYLVEAMYWGPDDVLAPCGEWFVTLPSHEPEDALRAELGVADLATNICGTGQISVGVWRPTSPCVPSITAQLVHDGGAIAGVLDGDTMRFSGVPPSGSITVSVTAGCLNATVSVPSDPVPCPSLGGEPATEDATVDTPGNISGVAPIIGCNITVAIVAVEGGGSVAVTWDTPQQWHADVPAGQYAVALGVGAGQTCIEEYVVEVGQAAVPCAGTATTGQIAPQTTFGVPNGSVVFNFTGFSEAVQATIELTHLFRLETESFQGPTASSLTADEIFSGEYAVVLKIPSLECERDLGTVVIPCNSEASRTISRDRDGDGDGNPLDQREQCYVEPGYIFDTNPVDCNDLDVAVRDGQWVRMDADLDNNGIGPTELQCGPITGGWRPTSLLNAGTDCDDTVPLAEGRIGEPCTPCGPCYEDCRFQNGCGCTGTPLPDADGDGVCDATDNCPQVAGQFGTACNDGNALTTNDVLDILCQCVGRCPNGLYVGTSCDDGDVCTTADHWDTNCACVGTRQDQDSDGTCDAQDNCPNIAGALDAACNDQDPSTINDKLTLVGGTCACVGSPCDPNRLVSLAIRTDAHGDEIGWQITDVTNASPVTVCEGTGLANSTTVIIRCCLVSGPKYKLTVTDSGGDGIVRGGYILTATNSGARIIDNISNFPVPGPSAVSTTESFEWPLGTTQLDAASCDRLDWTTGQYMRCDALLAVTNQWVPGGANSAQPANSGYEFWFFDPNGSFSYRHFRSHREPQGKAPADPYRATHLRVNGWPTSMAQHLPERMLLNVRVRGRINGNDLPFGPACRFKYDPSRATCPPSELLPNSCNVQLPFAFRSWIHAVPIHRDLGESKAKDFYEFRLRHFSLGTNPIIQVEKEPKMRFYWDGNIPTNGYTYEVDVRVSVDSMETWCAGEVSADEDWGRVCTVTVSSGGSGLVSTNRMAPSEGVDVLLYPDPVTEGQLFIHTTGLPQDVERVDVDIHSITGERVRSERLPAEAGTVHTRLDLPANIAPGVYLVVLRAEGERWTRRVVIQ